MANPFPFKCINLVFLFCVCDCFAAYARVNESIAECDKRYGNIAYKYSKGDFEYRVYNNKDKRIACYFRKSVSAMEIIQIGPRKFLLQEQGIEFYKKEVIPFYIGLLQNAYSFSQQQTSDLFLKVRRTDETTAESCVVNGDVRASFEMYARNSNEELRSEMRFRLYMLNLKLAGDDLGGFTEEAMTAENAALLRNRADGF